MSAAGDALRALAVRLDKATAKASLDGGLIVEAAAKKLAPVGKRAGLLGNTAYAPGTLRRSIDTTGPRPTGVASYATYVGPTVIYGRLRELGGYIPGGAVPRPKPPREWLRWVDEAGHSHRAKLVHQDGDPYLRPAVLASLEPFRQACVRRWSDAIRGV